MGPNVNAFEKDLEAFVNCIKEAIVKYSSEVTKILSVVFQFVAFLFVPQTGCNKERYDDC